MSRKNVSNYALVILFTFALTSIGLTLFVFPSYAAPTVTTFFSCETSDGCGYRYNTTLYLAPLPDNMTAIGDWSTSRLVYEMLGNESIIINGSAIPRSSPNALLHLAFKPAINGTMGLHIITDLNGQPNAESLEVEVNASSISAGLPVVFNAVIDKGASTGGDIHAYNVITTGSGTIQVVGLGVFSGVDTIHQHSGSPVNMDRALLYDGSFSDVTAAFTATGNDTSMFVGNGDSVYIGHASKFGEIQFNLDTLASGAGIQPTFEFSTGAGGWTLFSPIDATDGMRDDGAIAYEKDDLTGWATDTVSGFVNNFWIRINRTQVGLGTVPIEDLVQIVVDTDFIWDASGNVQIFGLNVTDDFRISSGKSIASLGGGIPDIVTFSYPSTISWNGTWTHDFNNALLIDISEIVGQPAATSLIIRGHITGAVAAQRDIVIQTGSALNPQTSLTRAIWQSNAANGAAGFTTNEPIIFGSFTMSGVMGDNNVLGSLSPTSGLHVNIKNAQEFTIGYNGGGVDYGFSTTRIDFNTNDLLEVGSITLAANNTEALYADGGRVADAYFVVSHVKSQVTDLQLEAEYKPDLSYTYNNGDVVCLKEWKIFTKCSNTYNKILGPIFMLRVRGITGLENITEYNMKLVDGILQNVSSLKQVDKWEIINYEPVIVVEGPFLIKACSPILEGQLIIAGDLGCAIGVNSYSDIPPLMLTIGYAAYDSKGGFVEAVIL